MSTNARTFTDEEQRGKRSGRDRFERKRDLGQVSKLLEKLPPHAIEAEMSLLGSILLDARVIGDVILITRGADDFYKPGHGILYDAMVKLYDEHATLDIVQLNQYLIDRDVIDEIGGQEYLIDLASAVPTAANATYYARLVREKAMIRELIHAAGEILQDAYQSPEEARAILDAAEQKIFHIAQQAEQTSADSLHDLIEQTMSMLDANEGRHITGVASGFSELDEITGGLQHGEMLILAARPSMGKTALALNIAEQIGLSGKGVGVFSLEMGKQQLVQRLLCARSGVDSQRLRRNMLRKEEWHMLHRACDQLIDAPIYIDDTPGLSLLQLRAKARRMSAKYQIQAIIIDYLQLMSVGGRVESRQQEVSEISRGIKAMARELNVPVICLSQLNRSPEQREGHRPRMSDLRESGSIEQDADVVMMLHREEYYHQGDKDWEYENEELRGVAELILTKQRNGPTGTVKLTWVSATTRFRDYAQSRGVIPGGSGYGGVSGGSGPSSGGSGGEGASGGASGGGSRAGSSASYEAKPMRASSGGSASQPPPFDTAQSSSAFTARPKTGPVSDFRDGGGPDADDMDDLDIPY